jgi:hypothetical protein
MMHGGSGWDGGASHGLLVCTKLALLQGPRGEKTSRLSPPNIYSLLRIR